MLLRIASIILPALMSGTVLILTIRLRILDFLNAPIDQNFKINNIRLFGENKTFRGPVIFVIISVLTSGVLHLLYLGGFSFVHPLFGRSPILIGFIFGLSYSLGELINSFIKRQKHISPGTVTKSNRRIIQRFFDLTDGIILIAFFAITLHLLTIFDAISAAVLGTLIHIITDIFMQNIGLKKKF